MGAVIGETGLSGVDTEFRGVTDMICAEGGKYLVYINIIEQFLSVLNSALKYFYITLGYQLLNFFLLF